MTGFATPPSTIRTISLIRIVTTHFKCDQRNFIISQVEYTRTRMVVDVTIEANSKTATYSIPENLSVTYAGDVVLSTDKQGLMAEVEQMKNTAEKILESVPKQKEVVDKTTVLLSELNPVYKEKKETEQRFSKIEESISRMESTVNNFINSFNHAQGNSNTAQ